MSELPEISKALEKLEQSSLGTTRPSLLKRLRGGFFFVLGYMLSPLSWWNDLFFNLPVAYGLGYLVGIFFPHLFLPAAIAGYWLSNVLGILLMQLGLIDVVQGEAKERNLKKELFTGVASSTVYTLVILSLMHFHILEAPQLALEDGGLDLGALLPFLGDR